MATYAHSTGRVRLPVSRSFRRRLEASLENITALLDEMDGEPKVEDGRDAETDPIFAAIARHRAALNAYVSTCRLTDEVQAKREGREITPADEALSNRASDEEADASAVLLNTTPMTRQGLAAILAYAAAFQGDELIGHPNLFCATLLRSPVLIGNGGV